MYTRYQVPGTGTHQRYILSSNRVLKDSRVVCTRTVQQAGSMTVIEHVTLSLCHPPESKSVEAFNRQIASLMRLYLVIYTVCYTWYAALLLLYDVLYAAAMRIILVYSRIRESYSTHSTIPIYGACHFCHFVTHLKSTSVEAFNRKIASLTRSYLVACTTAVVMLISYQGSTRYAALPRLCYQILSTAVRHNTWF